MVGLQFIGLVDCELRPPVTLWRRRDQARCAQWRPRSATSGPARRTPTTGLPIDGAEMMNLYGTRYDEITSARSTLPSRLQDRPEGEDKAERQGQHRMGRSLAGGPLAVRSGHRIFATSRLKLIRCRSPNNLDCGNNSKVNNSAPYNRVRQLGGHPASSVRVYQHAQILFSSAFERPLFGGPARPSISESKRGVRARSSPNACRSSKGRRADGQHPSCY
jgi:hypothetical protein